MKLSIFTYTDLRISGGSTNRILGYSSFIRENQIEVDFYNPFELPKALKKKVNHIRFNEPLILRLLLKYYCISPKLLFFLKYIINLFSLIKELKKIKNPIIFHQFFLICLFLTTTNKTCIYDIHGIREYQREYLEYANLVRKIQFFLDLIIEKNVFKKCRYFNVTSSLMKKIIIKRFKIKPQNIFIAEDGLLDSYREEVNEHLELKLRKRYNLTKDYKYIFFAGDFKKYGGVWDLVRAFYSIYKNVSHIKIILIGSGQDFNKVRKFIEDNDLKNDIILTGIINYRFLSTYQDIADIIVCPDSSNYYNRITPHIKVFDSLASGKPLVISNFKCLHKIIKDFKGFELFEPGNMDDLAQKILKILNNYHKYSKEAVFNKKKIEDYSYYIKSKKYFKDFKDKFLK